MRNLGLKLEERFGKLGYSVENEDYRLVDKSAFMDKGINVLGYSFVLKKDNDLYRFIICNTTTGRYSITLISKKGDKDCSVEFYKIFSTYTKEYIKELKNLLIKNYNDLLNEIFIVLIDYIKLDKDVPYDTYNREIDSFYYYRNYNMLIDNNGSLTMMDYKNDILGRIPNDNIYNKPYYPYFTTYDLKLSFLPDFYDVVLGGMYYSMYKSSDIVRDILAINDDVYNISITYNAIHNIFTLKVIEIQKDEEKLLNSYTLEDHNIKSMISTLLDILNKYMNANLRIFVGDNTDIKNLLKFCRPIIEEELRVFFNTVITNMNQLDGILTFNNRLKVELYLSTDSSKIRVYDDNDDEISISVKEMYNNNVLLTTDKKGQVIMNVDTLDINRGELYKRLYTSVFFILKSSFNYLFDERYTDLRIHVARIIELLLKDRLTYKKDKIDTGLLNIFDDSIKSINYSDEDDKAKSLYKNVKKLYAIESPTVYAFNISLDDSNYIITKRNTDFSVHRVFNSDEYDKYNESQKLDEIHEISKSVDIRDSSAKYILDNGVYEYVFENIPDKLMMVMRLINYRDIISSTDIVMSIFYHNNILKEINKIIDDYHMIDVTNEGDDENVNKSEDNNG